MHDIMMLIAFGEIASELSEKLTEMYKGKYAHFSNDTNKYVIIDFRYLSIGSGPGSYRCKVRLSDQRSVYKKLINLVEITDE